MSFSTIEVEPGYKGTVSGVTAARFNQRATVNIQDRAGRVIALTTFIGKGENVPLTQVVNPVSPAWSFGPFAEPVTLNVLIENSEKGDNFSPSKVILPIKVLKESDETSPATYRVSTILSEDSVDDDYTDCIITVFQYK
ncbi:hypothetical protein C0991_011898 [Blastosporella zonata]|nr:hypothetical protein C0991_011898 [Blastosporella zonata]